MDATGAVRARYDYDPYGARTANLVTVNPAESDFGFTGHYTHAASGLVLAPYRGYDPGTGRWLSRDPIEEDGGGNLYGYVENNPINLIDPNGAEPVTAAAATTWAVSSSAASASAVASTSAAATGAGAGGAALGASAILPVTATAAVSFGVGYGIGKCLVWIGDRLIPDASTPAPTAGPGRRAYEKDKEFRRWFHKEWKQDRKKHGPGRHNPDMDDDELDEAYEDWHQEGCPKTK